VKTALQVLARDPAGGDIADTVAAVDAEIRRVEGVARRLVSYARPLQPSLRTCSQDDVLTTAIAATRNDAVTHRVRVEEPRGAAPPVEADPDLLVQVFVNLLLNACQASKEGDPVRLAVRRERGSVVVEVVDEGAGLAPEVREHLFTPFVTTRREGHGLGLAVSQNIALAHGGRIEARPNQPRGTVFSVFLPEASA
jgi:signal transduction histidine kinase